MCIKKTVEQLVAEKSVGMTPAQKAEYWYELNQNIFRLLGHVEVPVFDISFQEWKDVACAEYQTLRDVVLVDSVVKATTLEGMQSILSLDWTNLVPYVAPESDCDKYASRLYNHLVDYYKITAVVPVIGNAGDERHSFNVGVFKSGSNWVARIVEPQSDKIIEHEASLGRYIPEFIAEELGVLRR